MYAKIVRLIKLGALLTLSFFWGVQRFSYAGEGTMPMDHPRLTPDHDSVIDYEFKLYPTVHDVRHGTSENATGPLRHVRIYYGGEGALTKIVYLDGAEQKTEIGSVIIDRNQDVVTVIMNGRRAFARMRNQEVSHKPFLLDLSMHFLIKNQDMAVLGRPCVVWRVLSKQGTSEACVTQGGFILKEDGMDMDGLNGSLLATRIEDKPLTAHDFEVPKGFHEDFKPKDSSS